MPVKPRQPGRARALVVDRVDPKRIWVGIEVGGVVSTDNGGATWRLDLPGNNPDIHMMAAHPGKPGVLFATTGYGRLDGVAEMIEGNAGVFRSDDAGATWRYVWRGVTPRYAQPMCIDPRAPYALTVASAPTAFSNHRDEGGAHAMLYRTEDGGETWRSLCDAAHSPVRGGGREDRGGGGGGREQVLRQPGPLSRLRSSAGRQRPGGPPRLAWRSGPPPSISAISRCPLTFPSDPPIESSYLVP